MNHAMRALRCFATLFALLFIADVGAQGGTTQRQPKAPATTAQAAVRTQPAAQAPYRQRAGIVIEMVPSPDRKPAVKPKP
ncbi:MAG: hypothetical protein NTW01_15505 [Gammaproteobacteria bacterium]|jgi:hypothetical protein|uniref:hypothetical protein n=1 Tax=Nevskia sp. TaxID=1929292 RepID=UPI00403542EE|nr:hypothetical protein [Gammaproteobacteria bacterium]